METPRHFLRQIPGYIILFGFCILLTLCTLVGGEDSEASETKSIDTASPAFIPTAVTSKPVELERQTDPPSLSPLSTASPTSAKSPHKISITKEVALAAKVSPQQDPGHTAAALASEREEVSTSGPPSTEPSSRPDVTHALVEHGATAAASDTQSTIDTRKGGPIPKSLTTPGEAKASPVAGTTVSATTMSKLSPKPSEKTTTHHMPDYHGTSSASTHARTATETGATGLGSSETQSSGNNHTGIILAVVLCVLFLLVVVGFLLCRRQRRSGSTSFSAAGWAGQVALPDDSGLDKDAEQGPAAGPAGEGEAKRNTLVTFFGKRQSRLPSVAMEDISGKGEQEECQQLLDGDVSAGGAPEGAGEANGKLAAPSAQASSNTGESS